MEFLCRRLEEEGILFHNGRTPVGKEVYALEHVGYGSYH